MSTWKWNLPDQALLFYVYPFMQVIRRFFWDFSAFRCSKYYFIFFNSHVCLDVWKIFVWFPRKRKLKSFHLSFIFQVLRGWSSRSPGVPSHVGNHLQRPKARERLGQIRRSHHALRFRSLIVLRCNSSRWIPRLLNGPRVTEGYTLPPYTLPIFVPLESALPVEEDPDPVNEPAIRCRTGRRPVMLLRRDPRVRVAGGSRR